MKVQKRIVCTDQEPPGVSPLCARIISVGANEQGGDTGTENLSVPQVVTQMDQGIVFYTYGETSRRVALVQKYWCMKCARHHIRSAPDAVTDNNLDSLRYCHWQKAA